MLGRVLIIAGSDSGGGAGIQADIKTVTALDGFAMTAVTALTVQDTQGVHGILDVPADFVAAQMRAVLADIGADCIKIGMLHRADVIEAVRAVIDSSAPGVPVVIDPVMVAKGGHPLLVPEAVATLKARLIPIATVLTPNRPEAEILAGEPQVADPERLAAALLGLGPQAVLLKGGHVPGPTVIDVLVDRTGASETLESPRIESRNTHGTGCTLASAIAVSLAQKLPLRAAVVRARAYVREAIMTAPGFGHGHGPLNHAHTVPRATAPLRP
ncbi:MAG: bifunctional hydroxymethylpyrimidine kinase/phosphomethylpyrimidine kinase [Rhodospirillales bacterium]|nr:MAG: bifunctional hydroxymethylpyrimidine kinase/phosphomethylpyrimidine kinase [Rhodospirillales bacterium]